MARTDRKNESLLPPGRGDPTGTDSVQSPQITHLHQHSDETVDEVADVDDHNGSDTPLPPEYVTMKRRCRRRLDSRRPNFLIEGTNVTINKTDGDPELLIPVEEERVSAEGEVNYRCIADDKAELSWRKKIGSALMTLVATSESEKERQYVLSKFPQGYALYVWKHGPKDNPRKDYYLHGSKIVTRFSSPFEFVMHALWLAQDCPFNNEEKPKCLCKYCGKIQSQNAISYLWTGKVKKESGRKRAGHDSRVAVQRVHEGIGGAVWMENESMVEDD